MLSLPAHLLHAILMKSSLSLADVVQLAAVEKGLASLVSASLQACQFTCGASQGVNGWLDTARLVTETTQRPRCCDHPPFILVHAGKACGTAVCHRKHAHVHRNGPLSAVFGSHAAGAAVVSNQAALNIKFGEEQSYMDGHLRSALAAKYSDVSFHDPSSVVLRVERACCSSCGVMLGLKVCNIIRVPSRPATPTGQESPTSPTAQPAGVPQFWYQRVSPEPAWDAASSHGPPIVSKSWSQSVSHPAGGGQRQYQEMGQVLLCLRTLDLQGLPAGSAAPAVTAPAAAAATRSDTGQQQLFCCQGRRNCLGNGAMGSGHATQQPDGKSDGTAGMGPQACGALLFTAGDLLDSFVARDAQRTLQVADLVTHLHTSKYKLDGIRTVKQLHGDDVQMCDVRCAQCDEVIGCKLLKLSAGCQGLQTNMREGRFAIFRAATLPAACMPT